MTVDEQIEAYFAGQPEPKRGDLRVLHARILRIAPNARRWFLDGRNSEGKVVSNPNVGYGLKAIDYADGTSRDFYQVGLSANSSGISVYVMDTPDKTHLARTYGERLGKATVTGYCIKFRKLADIDVDALEAAVREGLGVGG